MQLPSESSSFSNREYGESDIVLSDSTDGGEKCLSGRELESTDSTYLSSSSEVSYSPAGISIGRSRGNTKERRNEYNDIDTDCSEGVGVVFDGQSIFKIPQSTNSLALIFQLNSLPSWASMFFFALSIAAAFFSNSEYPIIGLILFWRVIYNLFVGVVLLWQSRSQYVTKWVRKKRLNPFSSSYGYLRSLLNVTHEKLEDSKNQSPGVKMFQVPAEYMAWTLVRTVVAIIESNDVWSFTLATLVLGGRNRFGLTFPMYENVFDYWYKTEPGQTINSRTCDKGIDYLNANYVLGSESLVDILGTLLIILGIYCKLFARQKTGEYGWYWGDFFFLRADLDQLIFDGIFELIPHPMYTAGYFWAYGCALLARSNTVLLLALSIHLSQLLFLWLVENPHMEKLYGAHEPRVPPHYKTANVFIVKNFDIYRASDVNLVLTLAFMILAVEVGSYTNGPLDSQTFFIGFTIFWQIVSTVVQGVVLLKQDKYESWTKHFMDQGCSSREAFDSWKRMVNMLQTVQYSTFLICAKHLIFLPATYEEMYLSIYVAQLFFGIMLIMISLWTFQACYQVLGDYGWFYGDFFLSPVKLTPRIRRRQRREKGLNSSDKCKYKDHFPSYVGIYRYMNNPMVYLGHLWMYGMALVCYSGSLFAVALIAHALKIYLLYAVEIPHMERLYKNKTRKSSTALSHRVRMKAKEVQSSDTAVFLANWVKHPIETGALAPSSQQLAIEMCNTMNIKPGSIVVELGPGTGPFTEEILKRMEGKGEYIGFELSDEFIKKLQERFPENKDDFLKRSAEDISKVLKERGIRHCDCILSGLPWAIFPLDLQQRILSEVTKTLKPGGRFCTFAYLQGLVLPAGQRFRSLLAKNFGKVERSRIVWKNLPPAFVYRCENKNYLKE